MTVTTLRIDFSKPGINSTHTTNRININSISSAPKNTNRFTPTVAKTKRPFKIRDIHTIDVPTESTIELSRLAADKLLKSNLEHLNQKLTIVSEVKPPVIKLETRDDFNITMQDTQVEDQSPIQFPITHLSLELDPIENMKDDNMFNPKALLEYFNVDSKSDKEIIPPPEEFCDTSAYSPTTPTPSVTYKLYESDCDTSQHSTWDDKNNLVNNTYNSYNPSPKNTETWTLSRDDENAYYTSQPISSVPWVISQNAGSSHVISGFRSSRTRLGQFKFVRKKPLKPRL